MNQSPTLHVRTALRLQWVEASPTVTGLIVKIIMQLDTSIMAGRALLRTGLHAPIKHKLSMRTQRYMIRFPSDNLTTAGQNEAYFTVMEEERAPHPLPRLRLYL